MLPHLQRIRISKNFPTDLTSEQLSSLRLCSTRNIGITAMSDEKNVLPINGVVRFEDGFWKCYKNNRADAEYLGNMPEEMLYYYSVTRNFLKQIFTS